jgi:hypothetical protein
MAPCQSRRRFEVAALLAAGNQVTRPAAARSMAESSFRRPLKAMLLAVRVPSHSLAKCVHLVEKRWGEKFSIPLRGWILELEKIDPTGNALYACFLRIPHHRATLSTVNSRTTVSPAFTSVWKGAKRS